MPLALRTLKGGPFDVSIYFEPGCLKIKITLVAIESRPKVYLYPQQVCIFDISLHAQSL